MSIILQICLALNLMYGGGNHQKEANQIYAKGAYEVQAGVVIIDTDEL